MTYLAKEDVEKIRETKEAFEGLCTTRYYSVRYFSAFGKYFCSVGGGMLQKQIQLQSKLIKI
jgi:hypothetical protein